VAWLFTDLPTVTLVSTFKGWFFVLVTSLLLFILIRRLIGDFYSAVQAIQDKEGELLESKRLLVEAQQTAGLGSYEVDLPTGHWKPSAICEKLLGIDADFDPRLAGLQSLVHPDDWDRVYRQFTREVLYTEHPVLLEYRIIRPSDGAERWIHAYVEVDLDRQHQPQRLHGSLQDVTDQKRIQDQISEAKNKLQATLDALPDLLFEVGRDGTIHQYHSHRGDLLAAPPELFLGKRFEEVLPPEAAHTCRQAIEEAFGKGFSSGHRYALQLPQGERWFELSVAPLVSSQHADQRFIFIARDITERQNAEKQLELAGLVFKHAREGIMVTDARGLLVDVNAAFTRITGYARGEVLGKNPNLLSSGRQGPDFYRAMWAKLLQAGHWSGEVWNRRKDGAEYAELLTISTVRNALGEVIQYVAMFSDITALKQYQVELEQIAHFDVLTGLPNRLLLADRLQQAMAQAARSGHKVMVAFLDLDGFKQVNDQHGHDVGDLLLVALGRRLSEHLREGDTLARLGGDEFVVILIDAGDHSSMLHLVARLIAATAEPFLLDALTLHTSASVGVTSYPQSLELDAEQLLRQADQAMYQAKLAGKNRFHVFDTQRDNDIRGHFESLERMRQALGEQEFVLHYQPKINMRSGQVTGVEALIRWQHPERGLLAPATFLPAIEEHQLSIDLGEWVMETALQQHEQWQALGLHLPVSVNVGALQLQQSDFVQRLQATLQRHPQVQASSLQIEILETSALQDMQQVTATIHACKQIGIDFALDDFGTGYSSLTYLRQLPVTVLKIDQSFVRDMLENVQDQAILRGVLGLAAAFGREVIAEGVETEAHGSLLLQLGCDAAQGYGIARPMDASLIPSWLHNWRPNPLWLAD
jgi:diguanylate cyclase (GGDEF)-like protein/PAS domain S-box-containing protein